MNTRPEIFNTDQDVQFTSRGFVGRLEESGIKVSMDGKGRALDNLFIERLWRSVKWEDIYPRGYETPREVRQGLGEYFKYYNERRPHQGLGYRTPAKGIFWEVELKATARARPMGGRDLPSDIEEL